MSGEVVALWYPGSVHGTPAECRAEMARLRDVAPDVRFVELHTTRQLDDLSARDAAALAQCSGAVVLADPALLLPHCPQLRWAQLVTTGFDHVTTAPLVSAGVRLASAAGTSGPEIAEFVLARVLEHWKRLPEIAEQQRRHRWQPCFGRPLNGSHVALVGFGSINQHVARLLAACGVTLTALRRHADHDPHPAHRVVALDQADHVLATTDAVVVALPATPGTIGMFDADWFGRMRPGSFFVNVGRGALVVEPDLVAALASGHLGGAAIDVTASEPMDPADALWDTAVRVSPHCSSVPARAVGRVLDLLVENLGRLEHGERLVNEIDLGTGEATSA